MPADGEQAHVKPHRDPLVMRRIEFPVMPVVPRPMPRPPEFGALSPSDARPAVVRRRLPEILAGFRNQQMRLQIGNRLVCVTRGSGQVCFPFEHPVLLISTSVRDYAEWPDTLEEEYLPAVALAQDRQWLDRMILVRDGALARVLAAKSEAPFALLWDAEGMSVLDVADGGVLDRFEVVARELTYRCCPLIADAAPGDRCRMYGGGSVSRAILAAGYWLDRRYVFLEELGCDEACSEASVRAQPSIPTRYYTWLTERQIADQWEGIVTTVIND